MDNARRYTRERATALALQRSLLPRRAARQKAVEVTARYLPNTDGAGIGGDWFDVIPLSGARVALVVGDVVGHGLHASAPWAGSVRRTDARRRRPRPRRVAHPARRPGAHPRPRAAGRRPEGGQVAGATCLYAVYDPATGHCTMARAGHPEPVLTRPGGSAEQLRLPPGPPLGVGGLPFESAEFELPRTASRPVHGRLGRVGRQGQPARRSPSCAICSPTRAFLDEVCDTVMETLVPSTRTTTSRCCWPAPGAGRRPLHSWDLPSDRLVADARRRVAARLAVWGLETRCSPHELVVSELVTNAIRYGGDPIRLRLIRDTALICEVFDGSSTAPHLRRAGCWTRADAVSCSSRASPSAGAPATPARARPSGRKAADGCRGPRSGLSGHRPSSGRVSSPRCPQAARQAGRPRQAAPRTGSRLPEGIRRPGPGRSGTRLPRRAEPPG
ncbi:SpoIIE family protein phosphatase [Streptomyces pratensis]|nr:SpoIIE family protein phosphatase [Streptomyces pratensis]